MSHDASFLTAHEPPRVRARLGRRRALRFALLAALLCAAAWVAALLFAGGRLASAAFDARDALEDARDAAQDLRFDDADDALAEAEARLADAEKTFPVLNTARWIPWVGTQIAAADGF